MSATDERAPRATFSRPHRTIGMRVIGATGAWLRGHGMARPLSSRRILASARRRTGLSDFGGDFFLEPLEVLVESFEKDARLTSFGRLLVHQNLANFAANRLRVQRDLRRIEPAPVSRPLFVLGLPRTGTTLLQQLLACDPGHRALLCWESFFPAPVFRSFDLRRPLTRAMVRGLDRVAPQLRDVHPITADEPEECTWLTANAFVSSAFSLLGRVERYEEWLDGPGEALAVRAYEDFARQLQVLQSQAPDPPRPWILKSPVHLRALGALLTAFPDARVLRTHRRPAEVVASTCSLFAIARGVYSDDVAPQELGPEVLRKLAIADARAAAAERAAPGRVVHVQMRELVKEPIAAVRRALGAFGDGLSSGAEARMEAWMAAHPAHGAHRYGLEQFGLSEADVERVEWAGAG